MDGGDATATLLGLATVPQMLFTVFLRFPETVQAPWIVRSAARSSGCSVAEFNSAIRAVFAAARFAGAEAPKLASAAVSTVGLMSIAAAAVLLATSTFGSPPTVALSVVVRN